MTEDILEQLVDGYFKRIEGVFSKHNVKYRPSLEGKSTEEKRKYSVHSDIDVISTDVINGSVYAISCKSWQNGFDCKDYWETLSSESKKLEVKYGRARWKAFREIADDVWAEAFRNCILKETGLKSFTYVIAVVKTVNDEYLDRFVTEQKFLNRLSKNGEFDVKIKILTLKDMLESIWTEDRGHTIESSEIGRFIQLLKAADLRLS